MKKRIISLFRKAYNRLFRKKTRRTIWGQKFDEDSFYSESYLSYKPSIKNLQDS